MSQALSLEPIFGGNHQTHKKGAGYCYKREELDEWLLSADRLTATVTATAADQLCLCLTFDRDPASA